jgi:hypothetical protein
MFLRSNRCFKNGKEHWHFLTTDGRTLILSRHTELNADQKLLLKQLKLDLPPQPLPRITSSKRSARPQLPVL